ncbi:MAG: S9 family peptidase [Paludibacteraceae bacterium]|nr:S9 family peptidase [Paludibacteraceae bacterium]
MRKLIFMATLALLAASCQTKEDTTKAPITKPQITIEGGRFTPEALWAMGRINSVLPNESTNQLAYTVSYYSVEENRSTSWIRVAKETENGKLETQSEWVGYEPAWWNDKIAYLNAGKLYIKGDKKDIALQGFDKDIDGFLISPQGDRIILIAQVKTVASTLDKHPDLPLASGRVVDDLMYKHWDEWTETAPHPFVGDLTFNGKSLVVNNLVDILDSTPYESPMKPFGGVEQLAWSPDGKQIAYTCRKKVGLDYAVSTNSDIYLYDIATATHSNITKANKGYDTNPSYSPNGQYVAWQSMERDGYESDENRLMIHNLATGEQIYLSKGLNTNVDSYYWKDDNTLVFSAVWHGTSMLYEVNIEGLKSIEDSKSFEGDFECLTTGQYDYVPAANVGNTYYCLRHSMREANEIFRFCKGETPVQISHENDNIYSQIEMGTVVPRWQKTTDNKDMLTWVIYPPHFDPNKKYPTLLYCEGGPQSPVSQFWSFRWNFMMMAANDYIVVAPNRRGLPGFGNEWNEQISGDYGGQCMKDYLSAIDEFVANEPYVDKDHLGCVGASFGGFSVYWLAGHHEKRFKAFIAHDGIFNMEMQYLETEEKWFANWDMGGAYWDKKNKIAQRTFANSPHLFVDKWDTPILCIHGEKDYRILANQGMAAFDAAKMRGVPAQLLIFPDENHWVLKPQNGILWQRTFFSWLDKWLKE